LQGRDHGIDDSGEFVSRRCQRFGCPHPGAKATEVVAQEALAVMETLCTHAEGQCSTIFGRARSGGKNLTPANFLVRTESQPRAERRGCREAREVRANLRLGGESADAGNLSQVDSEGSSESDPDNGGKIRAIGAM
jgi:hypothetical protein